MQPSRKYENKMASQKDRSENMRTIWLRENGFTKWLRKMASQNGFTKKIVRKMASQKYENNMASQKPSRKYEKI